MKATSNKHKFVIDFSRPAGDGLFDGEAFDKFLHDRIKVEGKAGQLGDNVKVVRDGMWTLDFLVPSPDRDHQATQR